MEGAVVVLKVQPKCCGTRRLAWLEGWAFGPFGNCDEAIWLLRNEGWCWTGKRSLAHPSLPLKAMVLEVAETRKLQESFLEKTVAAAGKKRPSPSSSAPAAQ